MKKNINILMWKILKLESIIKGLENENSSLKRKAKLDRAKWRSNIYLAQRQKKSFMKN